MDLLQLPAIFWRWRWMIALIIAVVGVATGLRLGTSPTPYEASVRVQITAPQSVDVPLVDSNYRPSSTLRDDLLVVHNNFAAVVLSRRVKDRTTEQLHLTGRDRAYTVVTRPLTDSDFIDLVVSARTPTLAQEIATVHAAQAIGIYGELRAKPAAATKNLLDAQLQTARDALLSLGVGATGSVLSESPGAQAANTATSAEAQQVRQTYQALLKTRVDAALAEENASRATFIQVVEPAVVPLPGAWVRKVGTLIGLSFAGSLGLCVLIALLLESLFPRASAFPGTNVTWISGQVDGSVHPAAPRSPDDRIQSGTRA